MILPLADLFVLEEHPSVRSGFHVLPRRPGARCVATVPVDPASECVRTGWWATERDAVGDAPGKYNAKYAMAVLSSKPAAQVNQAKEHDTVTALPQWVLPKIVFDTEEFTRRSMTLNGMRMSTEYFTSGSQRVIQLIEQRLEVGQRDVIHDVLVYLMRQVLDVRAQATEARLLRAESVAAYLGLDQNRTNHLFLTRRLVPAEIAASLEAGVAGRIRRAVAVLPLLEGQVRHLQPTLRHCRRQERRIMELIDGVTLRLYADIDV